MAEQFIASKQLPYVLQSPKLKNFFDSTFDQWFKNEDSVYEVGYVGQRQGRIFNSNKDSYLAEPTVDRTYYQLEPASVVRDADTQNILYQTTYNDIINKIRFDGGIVDEQSRLFESPYYSYAPPIDMDKFLNYANYYWYPYADDLSTETGGTFSKLPSKPVDGTSSASITLPTDIIGQKTYTAPDGTIFTNGLHIRFAGSYIIGTAFQYFYTVDSLTITASGSGYAVDDAIVISGKNIGKVTAVNGSGAITAVEITSAVLNDGDTPGTVTITTSAGTSGVITATHTQTSITYFIEGVGKEIKLIDTRTLRNVNDSTSATKDYVTIQRGATDGNLWSKSNGWVHKDTLDSYPVTTVNTETDQAWDDDAWDVTNFDISQATSSTAFQRSSSRRATRPIIEFKRDIELYDYGKKHLLDVTVIEPTLTKTQIEGSATINIDGRSIQNRDTILFINASSQDDYVPWDGTTLWDQDIDGDASTGGGGNTGGDLGWDVSSSSFTIGASVWQVSGVGSSIKLTQVASNLNTDDKVYIEKGNTYKGTEWYYDGYNWNQAQQKTKSNQAPLYNLYDNNKVLLSDSSVYSSSNFVGSKIFGYKEGTGTNDTELGFPLSYSSGADRSDIQYCNFLNEDTYSYGGTTITGYKYYKQFTYPETIDKIIDYEVNVNPNNNGTGNRYYIDGKQTPSLILVRGNTYNFRFSSPESSTAGYSNANHPFYISTGTTWSSGTYTGEYTGGITGSRAYYGGTDSILKFKVPSTAPDTLYYNCGVHDKMGGKLVIVDNPVTTLAGAEEIKYANEWVIEPTKKLTQRLIQEHVVSNRNITTPIVLEAIPTSVLDMEVFKNGEKLKFGTDYTTTDSVILNFVTPLVAEDFIKVFYATNSKDPLQSTNYYEVPKNLENNASNQDIGTTTYSELFQHFKSIVQNQLGFTGTVSGNNNYRDTKEDLSLGSVILQHDAPLLKAMAIMNNEDLDIPESLDYVKNRYQEFQLKFLNAVNNIQNSDAVNSLTTAQIVDRALADINLSKLSTDPFAYSNMVASGDRYTSETYTINTTNYTWGSQSTLISLNNITQTVFNNEPGLDITSSFDPNADYQTKALYVYKNNVQLTLNHDYIISTGSNGTKIVFLGTPSQKPQISDVITLRYYESYQPTWIPPTPASLGIGRIYRPSELVDSTTYTSGTRNFIQCHDGSLVLKYNDMRDTALLELEKRIYNSMYHVISQQDKLPLFEYNQIIPNKFNSTSWTKDEITRLMRPIFSRWANENAVNYQDNSGYAVEITLSPNSNYVVTNYVQSGYVPTSATQKFQVGEEIFGTTSGARGIVTSVSVDTNTININAVTDRFLVNEVILGQTSLAGRRTSTINIDWRVLNYSTLTDQDGLSLPGHWRGIYRYYYGTDRPHTHPWEMLGFSQKPIWWDQYYTWTNPTIRTQLISDIEQGIIRAGERENYTNQSYLNENNVYKKPGFSNYVPVDANANLLSPLQIGIISSEPAESVSQADWKFGDGAPVEHAFYTSLVYPYVIQKLLYLTNPGLYVEQLWNVQNIESSKSDTNQTIDTSTGKRSNNTDYYVHTETDSSNTRYIRSGIQNFISDYVISKGNPINTAFGNVIRNIQSNLMYRCAGFIDSNKLQIESEAYDSTSQSTSIIVPPEDVSVNLYTGGSIQEASYSAMIVQNTSKGYKIYGYDITNPYFTIYNPLANSSSRTIRVGGKDISPGGYQAGLTYHKDEVVNHESKFYQCTIPHQALSSDTSPNLKYWREIKKLPQQGGTEVERYTQFNYSQTVQIDYGTVYKTRQEVYNALVGYGEYLKAQGWLFDQHNSDLGENLDWDYSAKEFLFWSLGKWQNGDYITLSPSASTLKFKPMSGIVQSLSNIINGSYSALNKEGFGLDAEQMNVMRDNDMVTVSHKQGIGIYGLRLYVKETEHAITLNNKTIFNDTIYNTLLAQRQPRVKISTVKTLGWKGKLEADGFIVSGTSLINNFEKTVADTNRYYDIDASTVDSTFRDSALHVIGYQKRDYLTNLGVSESNQVKLYQGMIKQKGTTNAIDRLLRSTTVSTDQTFDTYEEWAFKVGEFGSTNFNQQIELRLRSQDIITDPLMFEFILPTDNVSTENYDSLTDDVITIDIDDTTRWLKKPTGEKTLANLWPTVSTVDSIIPSAGYVHLDDSKYQAYDSTALDNLYGAQTGNVDIGVTSWVAKDTIGGKDWNIYKLYDTNVKIDNVISNGDANTAMKVTVNGTGLPGGATTSNLVLHKTYKSDGTLLMDPTVWGTHKLTLVPTSETAPTVTIPFANVAGNGASLAVGNIAGAVASVTVSSGGSGFAQNDVITFSGTTGTGANMTVNKINDGQDAEASITLAGGVVTGISVSNAGSGYSSAPDVKIVDANGTGATATATINASGQVTGVTVTAGGNGYTSPTVVFTGALSGATGGNQLTLNTGGSNYSAAPTGISVRDKSGTLKTLNVDYSSPSFTFTGSGTSGRFGEILDFVITSGGTNYQAPTITVIDSAGSTAFTIASGGITTSAGVITAITVPAGTGNQGFASGITSTATGRIVVKDSKTNFIVNFNTGLTKVHALDELTANVTTAWDGTAPTIVVESWDGATATTLYTVPTANLQSVASSNITAGGTVTDNANVTVRANVSVSSATTGNVSLTLNYKSKQYSIEKTDGTPQYVTSPDNTEINSTGIKLLDWKDIRLNKGLTTDNNHVSTDTATTLTNFLSSAFSDPNVWQEGDLVWLDNDYTGYWGVYRFTANASIISTYNSIRGTEPSALTLSSYGNTQWILHSGVDYSDSTKTTAEYFASTKRRQQDKVDTKQFEKAVLYDDRNNKIDLTLIPYDPAKGILPPQADREIEYKTEIDPAVYNYHSDSTKISKSKPWQEEYVGQVWWDLSTVRYIDYESHDNRYRRSNWGRLFPTATIDIYEWVQSNDTPTNYSGTGTVKSTTDYATKVETNPSTSVQTTTYYFWVKNVTTVPEYEGRINDTSSVANIITSPITQGLNYFAPISQNSISIANVLDFTTKQNTVLQLNYRKRNSKDKTNSKHAQWLLLKENYPDAPIPDQIWNKMVDSVTGFDVLGNTVPDTTLSLNDRYGSKVRPRQSWFVNSKNARKILVEVLNRITTSINLDVNHAGWDNTLTTSNYYEKTNWYYNTSFDDNTVIDRIVDYYTDIDTSTLSQDDVVKVNFGYNSKWELWQYTDADYLAGTSTTYDNNNLSLVRIGLQTATAKLKTTVYTEADSSALSTELRTYINTLKDNVLISQNLKYQNELLFALIRYVISEQQHVDWLFKSTYLNVIQQDTALSQKSSFEKDPFNDVKTYIEEVKPYRAKIRNFLSKKSPVRESADMAMSDFTTTADYVINSNGTGTTNPTPKVKTKIAFDRVSTSITLVSPSTNVISAWATSQSYAVGTNVKYNGGFWQATQAHTSGNFITDVQSGKWQHTNFEPTTEATDVAKINQLKSVSPTATHVDRLGKYFYASELANVDTANADSVSSFVTTLADKIGFYKDLDVQPIGFKVNRDRIGQQLTNFAWDSLDWDMDALSTNPTIGYDPDATQNWYESKFVKMSNHWESGVTYTANTFVRNDDLTHIASWSASTSYTVGDIVKDNNKVYVANVTHKNLASETTLQTSRWDLINDRIYFTNVEHTSSSTFKSDYDAQKWILVKSQLDSAGFARPDRDPYPEELLPITPRESLMITVKTHDGTSGSGTDADPYVGTGDYSQFKIHYSPYGRVEYLRDKFVDDGGTSSTDDHTTLNGAITESSNNITVADATKIPQPKQISSEVDDNVTNKPGVIWIGTERIEYGRITGNVLTDVVRGTHGTTIQSHADAVDVYSGTKVIPDGNNRGFWNSAGVSMLQSSTAQANYLTNNENLIDYVDDTYVDIDYV